MKLMPHFLIPLFICFFVSSTLFSQTFIYETFEAGQMPPAGWTINGLASQWAVTNSHSAGSESPEGIFNWTSETGTSRLISPQINLDGISSVKLTFRHYFDLPSIPSPSFGVATRHNNGPWNVVYQVTPTVPVGPEKVSITIANADVGEADFQFCIFLDGNFFNMWHYYIDDIFLFHPLACDAALVSLKATHPYFANPDTVKGRILNAGLNTVNSAVIQWQLDDGQVFATTFSGLSIQPEQTCDFACNGSMAAPLGNHLLKVEIVSVNGAPDNYAGNDTLSKSVKRVSHLEKFRPLHEEFTSSTCFPCANFNQDYVPWCEEHENDITLVKYQMNFPGIGDPYYTNECGVREDYYSGYFVPDLYHRGKQGSTDIESVVNDFADDMTRQGRMKIAATHSLDFNTIRVKATVLPFDNLNTARLYITVMEKVTHNNARNNGETSFEHVMMKMIPDAYGTLVNLADRTPVTISDTVDLTGTHVEEWNDLIVGVFVQNYQNREVYQSAYSAENGVLSTEARLSAIFLDGQPLAGFSPDQMDYTVFLPAGTTHVPIVTATPVDSSETVMILPDFLLPGYTKIDVFAGDLVSHNQYSVHFVITGVNIEERKNPEPTVFPNPSNGVINLENALHSEIIIRTVSGTPVRTYSRLIHPELDLRNLDKGLYFLEIKCITGFTFRKKIILY